MPHLTQAQHCPVLCQPQLCRPPSLTQCPARARWLLSWLQGDVLGSVPHPFPSTGHLEAAPDTLNIQPWAGQLALTPPGQRAALWLPESLCTGLELLPALPGVFSSLFCSHLGRRAPRSPLQGSVLLLQNCPPEKMKADTGHTDQARGGILTLLISLGSSCTAQGRVPASVRRVGDFPLQGVRMKRA